VDGCRHVIIFPRTVGERKQQFDHDPEEIPEKSANADFIRNRRRLFRP
jgi:hypothetical protein